MLIQLHNQLLQQKKGDLLTFPMDAIELKNVTKVYRKGFRAIKIAAIQNLSLSIRKHRVTGFIGPNGAGKTTTLKMIMGLVRPSAGTISLLGTDASSSSARKGVAYLSEQPYFYGHLTVSEMLRFAGNLLNLSPRKLSADIDRVLSLVELKENGSTKVKELSKGMQQRLNMAQALLGDPHTLILDEPMSGMDPPGRSLFRRLLKNLSDKGTTIFFSTHVLDDIEAVCDDVIVLSRGKLTYAGRIAGLLEQGFLGIEMVVSSLDEAAVAQVQSFGCEVTRGTDGDYMVFLPEKRNSETVQGYLCSRNVVFRSIVKRSKSLEELLYTAKPE